MKFKPKKKRKGSESDYSDSEGNSGKADKASAQPDEDDANKRRSGRNTSRKKYVDELDINLSDEEHLLIKEDAVTTGTPNDKNGADAAGSGQGAGEEGAEGNLVKPNFVYIVSLYFVFTPVSSFFFIEILVYVLP